MAEPPEFLAFAVTNLAVLVLGGLLVLLSLAAARRANNHSLRLAAMGFGLIAGGTVLDAVYELGIRGSFELTGRELVVLHTVQTLVVGAGLAVIFLALRRN